MSKIIGDTACPACQEMGHDSTSNHLILFSDGGAYCGKTEYHRDGKAYYEKNGEVVMDESKEIASLNLSEIEGIKKLPHLDNPIRGTTKEDNAFYRIRFECSEETGEIERIYYPYTVDGKPSGYKVRERYQEWDKQVQKNPDLLGVFKKFRTIGQVRDADFFGEYFCKNRRIIITEGEEDCVAARKLLLSKYDQLKWDIVSLPTGASYRDGKAVLDKGILKKKDWLEKQNEIVLCLDQDDAGKATVKAFVDWLGPDKIKYMSFSEKDASDMLKRGKGDEFISSFFNAKKYVPECIIMVEDVYEDAIRMPTWGRNFPWPSLTKVTYGKRPGEGYYIGAGVKVGKSEALNELAYHSLMNGDMPLIVKGEEIPGLTVKKLAGKTCGIQFHKPDGSFTQGQLIEAVGKIKGRFLMCNVTIWDEVKSAIRTAVMMGTKDIFIDPITCFTDGMAPSDVDTFLKGMARELDNMAKDLGFTYFVFCHLNAPTSGPPHEEGGRVKSAQFTGSRVMMRACSYMIGLERNKLHEDEVERNTTRFRLLEDRMFGNYIEFPVFYNRETGEYKEPI